MPEPQRQMIRLNAFYRGNVAKSTAYKWIAEGRLKVYHVGGMVFVDVTFAEFIERESALEDAAARVRGFAAPTPAARRPRGRPRIVPAARRAEDAAPAARAASAPNGK
jgi:hypothetical protein